MFGCYGKLLEGFQFVLPSTTDRLTVPQKYWIAFQIENLTVLHHKKNLGKGAALITGFRHILAEFIDIDAVLTLDGDGQHDPSLIPLFIEEFERSKPELAYGNRFANRQGMPWHRAILNELSIGLSPEFAARRFLIRNAGSAFIPGN